MILRLTANIEGDLFFPITGFSVYSEFRNVHIELKGLADKVEKIIVSTKVPEEESPGTLPRAEFDSEKGITKIHLGGSPTAYNLLVNTLQSIESKLGYFTIGGLRKIWWEYPFVEFLPESNDSQDTPAHSYSFGPRQYSNNFILDPRIFDFVANFDNPEVEVLTAFWREGKYQQTHNHFIEAIYNFYFIVEDAVVHGKYKEAEKSIKNDEIFIEDCKEIIAQMCKEDKHAIEFTRLFKFGSPDFTPETIAKTIVDTRGNLHHFNSKQKSKNPFPFSQNTYISFSILFEKISWKIIRRIIGKLPFSFGQSTRKPNY